jgi:hypothetical protein
MTNASPAQVPINVERLTGHGRILHGSQTVLETDYDLTLAPPSLRSVTFEPGNHLKVSPDITGRLMGPLFQAEQLHGVHTLVLDDGRAFDFQVIQPDTNEIVGVSVVRDFTDP